MKPPAAFVCGALSAVAALLGVAFAFVYGGWIEVSALESHSGAVVRLLETARNRAIHARLAAVEVPPLADPELVQRGLPLYRRHCADCHGAPGVSLSPAAQGMNPVPPELVFHDFASEREAAEAYWVIANGIRMTGMPGFGLALDDDEIWALVALLRTLPDLDADDYRSGAEQVPTPPGAYAPPAADTGS